MGHPAEPAVGGLGLGAGLGGLLGLLALGLGRVAAGVHLGSGVGLDLGVGPEQRAGDLVGIDPDGQVEGVVDDVLFEVERGVEDVVAARPADRDPVVRLARAVAADGVLGGRLEKFLAEGQGAVAADPEPDVRHSTIQEAHVGPPPRAEGPEVKANRRSPGDLARVKIDPGRPRLDRFHPQSADALTAGCVPETLPVR